MTWYAISGSWRDTDERVRRDVRDAVKTIISRGDGILTGGALGVDYVATQVVLERGDVLTQLKLFLPIKLDDFCMHYRRRAEEGVITRQQADMIIGQLECVKRIAPDAIHDDTGYTQADKTSYYARNTSIIEACDELLAFQVNKSQGTQDAINKAEAMGKRVELHTYSI